jgi:hypothetical protein
MAEIEKNISKYLEITNVPRMKYVKLFCRCALYWLKLDKIQKEFCVLIKIHQSPYH